MIQPCSRCRRHVLVARSSGLLVRVDPENLTIAGELATRLQDRSTFDIHILGLPRRMYLEYRDVLRIRASRKYPVVAEHQCRNELTLIAGTQPEVTDIVIRYGKELPDVPSF